MKKQTYTMTGFWSGCGIFLSADAIFKHVAKNGLKFHVIVPISVFLLVCFSLSLYGSYRSEKDKKGGI